MGDIFGYSFIFIFFLDENLGIFVGMLGEDDDGLFWIIVSFYMVDVVNGYELWLNVFFLCIFLELFMKLKIKKGKCVIKEVLFGWLVNDFVGIYCNDLYGDIVIVENNGLF